MPASLREAARLLEQAADMCKDDHAEDALRLTTMAEGVLKQIAWYRRGSPVDASDELTPDVNPHWKNEEEAP